MSRPTTAVLLSALVLPGAGHLYLKHFGRGAVLIGMSLVCLWFIIDRAMEQASLVIEKLESEGGALDMGRLTDLATQTPGSAESPAATAAMLVLLACWLTGIVDAYRLGKRQS